jgi:hypothetical protein
VNGVHCKKGCTLPISNTQPPENKVMTGSENITLEPKLHWLEWKSINHVPAHPCMFTKLRWLPGPSQLWSLCLLADLLTYISNFLNTWKKKTYQFTSGLSIQHWVILVNDIAYHRQHRTDLGFAVLAKQISFLLKQTFILFIAVCICIGTALINRFWAHLMRQSIRIVSHSILNGFFQNWIPNSWIP